MLGTCLTAVRPALHPVGAGKCVCHLNSRPGSWCPTEGTSRWQKGTRERPGFLQPARRGARCHGTAQRWGCPWVSHAVPPQPEGCRCPPCLPSPWGGGTSLHWGWVPQVPQPRSSSRARPPKDAAAGRASGIPWHCDCPEVCAAPGGGRWPGGPPSSAPAPWAASLDDFDSHLLLKTKPALNSLGTRPKPIHAPSTPTERPRGAGGAPSGWPLGKGPRGRGARCPLLGLARSSFPCLFSACYLETSELPAPASARAA